MSGTHATFRWDDREAQAMLKKVIARLDNLRPVMKVFGEYMLVQTEKRFAGEHDPDGRPLGAAGAGYPALQEGRADFNRDQKGRAARHHRLRPG